MELKIMNQSLRVRGEDFIRSSPVRNCRPLKIARKESKVQVRRYEEVERGHVQGRARIRTSILTLLSRGKSTQSKSSRETNVQGKNLEETGKTLIKRERGSAETVLDHRLKQRCNRC
jgi:hypothetical protein